MTTDPNDLPALERLRDGLPPRTLDEAAVMAEYAELLELMDMQRAT